MGVALKRQKGKQTNKQNKTKKEEITGFRFHSLKEDGFQASLTQLPLIDGFNGKLGEVNFPPSDRQEDFV